LDRGQLGRIEQIWSKADWAKYRPGSTRLNSLKYDQISYKTNFTKNDQI